MLNIFITNLGKYNEGELVGEWIKLPVSEEEFKAAKKRIGINEYYEEYFISDYECSIENFKVEEYEYIDFLNEVAEAIENMTEDEQLAFDAMLEAGYDFHESMEKLSGGEYAIYNDCKDMTDVAYEVVESCGYLDNVPENVARYFDYEAFGRDLMLEGYNHYIFVSSGDCVEINA